jgi:hypothetical protein
MEKNKDKIKILFVWAAKYAFILLTINYYYFTVIFFFSCRYCSSRRNMFGALRAFSGRCAPTGTCPSAEPLGRTRSLACSPPAHQSAVRCRLKKPAKNAKYERIVSGQESQLQPRIGYDKIRCLGGVIFFFYQCSKGQNSSAKAGKA